MENFQTYLERNKEIGYINALSQSIAYIIGLPSIKIGETIVTESGRLGIVHGIKEELIEVLMTDTNGLKVKERVARTGEKLKIRVNDNVLGRIINPLIQPIDNLGPIKGTFDHYNVEEKAPPFIDRVKINRPLETGVLAVDLLVPIGYGQRELIIGDAKTGKTTFILQTILSQAKKEIISVYVGIGRKDIDIKKVEEYLKDQGVIDKTVIIHTTPDDPPTLIYLAPFSGMAIAEYFRDKGKDVLVIFDDLSTHAKIYREISLLLKRTPGRESYPGNIFHLHAKLLERAGNIKIGSNEASITALPLAETLENNLSGYIQTNLIAITDGHIFFDSREFKRGKRPAINTFLSVSRVGNQTKALIEKQLAEWFRKRMIWYQRAMEISQFGAELPEETKEIINIGKKIEILLNQSPKDIYTRDLQLILIGLFISNFWKNKPPEIMRKDIEKISKLYREDRIPKISENIKSIKDLDHLRFLINNLIPEIEKLI